MRQRSNLQGRSIDRPSNATSSRLETLIPGGSVTPETKRQLAVTNEVVEFDRAGFPTIVRQQVKNKFLKMVDEGLLTMAEATAAIQLRCYADQVFSGTTPAYAMRVDHSRQSSDGAVIARVESAQKVRDALESLSPELRRVAVAYIIDGPESATGMQSSFTSIGAAFISSDRADSNRIAGKALVVATCRDLAVHFRRRNPFEFDIAQGITGLKVSRIRSAKL